MVLTQQEFEAEKLKILVRFPYHYGSHATIVKAGTIVGGNTSFHTTMVLTQPGPRFQCRGRCNLFPYHYGSHATHKT